MSIIQSQINTASDLFAANTERMRALVLDVRSKAAQVEKGGSEEARERHLARGKLLPRERIAQLLDPGSPFLEIGQFAAWEMYEDSIASAALIAGIGHWMMGSVNFAIMGSLLAGSIPGIFVGSYFAIRIPERALQLVLA